jgi:tetratricopeptide (TPR) repeat protein
MPLLQPIHKKLNWSSKTLDQDFQQRLLGQQNRTAKTAMTRLFQKFRRSLIIRTGAAIALTLLLSFWFHPAQADPFRTANAHAIGSKTEAAFKTLFEQGNYQQAEQMLQSAEPDEPLAHAMQSALAYVSQDWEKMGENARLTRETAEKLVSTDALRGHLYVAAGQFLEGAYTLSTQGTVAATPTILAKLQQVFDNISQAEKIDPQDPELNLMKGFMDLMLAVNLPFANPDQAIERLASNAAPVYLAQRGIAIGYRDLDQPDKAFAAVEEAIKTTPGSNNPELFYLKAQILRQKGDKLQGDEQAKTRQDSVRFFRKAWALRDRFPESLVRQLSREGCRTFQQSRNRNPDACSSGSVNWQGNQQRQG